MVVIIGEHGIKGVQIRKIGSGSRITPQFIAHIVQPFHGIPLVSVDVSPLLSVSFLPSFALSLTCFSEQSARRL